MAAKSEITGKTRVNKKNFEGMSFKIGSDEGLSTRQTSARSRLHPESVIGNGNYDYISTGSPFCSSSCGTNVTELIRLSKLAFYNSQAYRNALLNLIFLSNTRIIVRGQDENVNFFKSWLEKINIWQLCNEFFTEWYRSGNLFLWKAFSEYKLGEVRKMTGRETVAKNRRIPTRYIMLDPEAIHSGGAANLINQEYYKILTQFEVEKLKNPSTPQDREFYDSLSAQEKQDIKTGISPRIRLTPENLVAIFNNKQPYEPLAIPTFTPILKLVNLREFMHASDKSLLETIDLAVLFCTAGTEDGDLKAFNKTIIEGLTRAFSARSASKTIVTHHSAKASFILPDLSKVMSPDRYAAIDREIAAGLMDLFSLSDSFSSSYVKSKIYLELLKQGQDAFITQFLRPEMKAIAEELGFTSVPEVEFEAISLENESEKMKLFVRLFESGALTAEGLQQAMEDKTLPLAGTNVEQQKEFKKLKDQGLYQPIAANVPQDEGRPVGATKTQTKKSPKAPAGSSSAESVSSLEKIRENAVKMNSVFASVESAYKAKHSLGRLTKKHKSLSDTIAINIIASEPIEKWEDSLAQYLENPFVVGMNEQRAAIMDIMQDHDVPTISAAMLYHGRDSQE